MSRNRIITQCEALFVGPSPATGNQSGVLQLHRIQSANYSENITRQDINQWGNLGAIGREIIQAPTVSLDFSFYNTNMLNETRLGFLTDGSASAISGIINKTSDEKNYFILTAPQGDDANNGVYDPADAAVEAFGNGFISSYTADGQVGNLPTVRVQVQALNFRVDFGTSGLPSPAVNPEDGSAIVGSGTTVDLPAAVSGLNGQVTALRPGDITVDISSGTIGYLVTDLKIQRYSVSVPLTRESLRKLGSRFDFAKEIQFPINAQMTVEALIGDYTSGSLQSVLCNDAEYDLSVTMRKPVCSGVGPTAVLYQLKKAKIDSQNTSSQIGQNKTVSIQFSTPITGPSDLTRGIFMSGIQN